MSETVAKTEIPSKPSRAERTFTEDKELASQSDADWSHLKSSIAVI